MLFVEPKNVYGLTYVSFLVYFTKGGRAKRFHYSWIFIWLINCHRISQSIGKTRFEWSINTDWWCSWANKSNIEEIQFIYGGITSKWRLASYHGRYAINFKWKGRFYYRLL